MWAGFLILTRNENLTDEEMEDRLDPYCTLYDIPEYEYGKIEEFRETYEEALERFPFDYKRFEEELKEDPDFAELSRPKMEALKEKDIKKYIVAYGQGDYRVEGDVIFCNKNYKEGKFDFCRFSERGFDLITKDGQKVKKCKTSDWDYVAQEFPYELLYNWEEDRWQGNIVIWDKAEKKEWEENFSQLIEEYIDEETYVYVLEGHI